MTETLPTAVHEQRHQPADPVTKIRILAPYHYYSANLAKQHAGIAAAVLLRHIAKKCGEKRNYRKGRHWYYASLDELAKVFPYLGRSTINDTLMDLVEKQVLLAGRFNKLSFDRTRWYAFVSERGWFAANLGLRGFRTDEAVEYGLVAAAVLENIADWVHENRKTDEGYIWHKVRPSTMSNYLGCTPHMVRNALKKLIQRGVLEAKQSEDFERSRFYRICEESEVLHLRHDRQNGSVATVQIQEIERAIANNQASIPNAAS